MSIDLSSLTIRKAHEGLKNRHFSAVELLEAYLEKITGLNPKINAYLAVFDSARAQAEEVDKTIRNSSRVDLEKKFHLLAGIPFAIKDNILIKGEIASSASKILENYRATYDATVIERLRKTDAVFIGRTNMDEFAMGGSTENSAYGPTANPHDVTRVPGGSSGGSAAAVAADLALVSLGSDTGGSVRQPASYCGIVGLKPTYGAVSRYGLMAMASSLDQIGPMGKTVDDVEIVYRAIVGRDPMDATSLPDVLRDQVGSPREGKMRLGVPVEFLQKGVDPEVLANFNKAVDRFQSLGYEIVPVDLPYIKYALAVYYILMPAEASTNLARYDGVKYGLHVDGSNLLEDYTKTRGKGFGKEVRRRIVLGTYVLSAGYYDAYYKKAIAVQEKLKREFIHIFSGPAGVDAIITPTAPTPAFKIGEKTSDPLAMYLADIFTVPANIAGLPAISVPSGFTENGQKQLPIGLQIMTPHNTEDRLFAIAKDFTGESRS